MSRQTATSVSSSSRSASASVSTSVPRWWWNTGSSPWSRHRSAACCTRRGEVRPGAGRQRGGQVRRGAGRAIRAGLPGQASVGRGAKRGSSTGAAVNTVQRRVESGEVVGEPVRVGEAQVDPAAGEPDAARGQPPGQHVGGAEVADRPGVHAGVAVRGQRREQVLRADERVVRLVDAVVARGSGHSGASGQLHSAITSMRWDSRTCSPSAAGSRHRSPRTTRWRPSG